MLLILGGHFDIRLLLFIFLRSVNYIPVSSTVYAIGKVDNVEGRLAFIKGGDEFFISTKSEEEMLDKELGSYYLFFYGGLALFTGGFAWFVVEWHTYSPYLLNLHKILAGVLGL